MLLGKGGGTDSAPALDGALPAFRPAFTDEAVRAAHGQNLNIPQLEALFGRCRASVVSKLKKLELAPNRSQRRQRDAMRQSRHETHAVMSSPARMPAADHPAFTKARTLFPSTVAAPADRTRVLISGFNSPKTGRLITKGRWKGFPIYTLTLEERATCPTSCVHWRSCFGNQMHFAVRIRHGDDLHTKLQEEVCALAGEHPKGFAVRLHVLGDFYSVEYVDLWRLLLIAYPQLHVFGFTARWQRDDPIAVALIKLAMDRWDRFAMRFSNAPVDQCSTVSIEHPLQKPADAIVCPQQLGTTQACATCALCWQSKRRIAFVRH